MYNSYICWIWYQFQFCMPYNLICWMSIDKFGLKYHRISVSKSFSHSLLIKYKTSSSLVVNPIWKVMYMHAETMDSKLFWSFWSLHKPLISNTPLIVTPWFCQQCLLSFKVDPIQRISIIGLNVRCFVWGFFFYSCHCWSQWSILIQRSLDDNRLYLTWGQDFADLTIGICPVVTPDHLVVRTGCQNLYQCRVTFFLRSMRLELP
jgi:hypothetical protein